MATGRSVRKAIHHLAANTVKQFLLVAYVMVQRSLLNVQTCGEFASRGSVETLLAEQIRGCIEDACRGSTGGSCLRFFGSRLGLFAVSGAGFC